MNRSPMNDSNLSLDATSVISDSPVMIAQPYQLYVERTDATKNVARYYAMVIEPTLFGTACLTRRWGRIGSSGQQKVHHFDREEEAVRLFLDLLRLRRAHGYRPPDPNQQARPASGRTKRGPPEWTSNGGVALSEFETRYYLFLSFTRRWITRFLAM